jgi:hypothetical protein
VTDPSLLGRVIIRRTLAKAFFFDMSFTGQSARDIAILFVTSPLPAER